MARLNKGYTYSNPSPKQISKPKRLSKVQEKGVEKVINMMADVTIDGEDIYQEIKRRYGKDVADAYRDKITKAIRRKTE